MTTPSFYTDEGLKKDAVFRTQFYDEVVNSLVQSKSNLLLLPTGSGKTYISILFLLNYIRSGHKVIFLAPTNILVKQQFDSFIRVAQPNAYHLVSADEIDEAQLKSADIVFMTGSLLYHRLGKINLSKFGLIVFDEIHNVSENSPYAEVLRVFKGRILGLSASIGDSLGLIKMVHPYEINIVEKQIKNNNLNYSLVPCEISSDRLKQVIHIKSVIEQKLNKQPNFLALFLRNRLTISELLALPNFVQRMLLIRLFNILQHLVTQPPEVYNFFYTKNRGVFMKYGITLQNGIDRKTELILSILQSNPCGLTIIFAEYVETVKYIQRVLSSKGISSVCLLGKINKIDQRTTLDDFRSGKYRVMISSKVGEEGLDIAQAQTCIFYEPVVSHRRLIQRIGRIARRANSQGNIFVLYTKDSLESQKVISMIAVLGVQFKVKLFHES